MAAAIRKVTVQRGHDLREHAMVVFGGAGGQHACLVAKTLGITLVVATGFPLGKEGPMVHIGAAVASLISNVKVNWTHGLVS